MKNLIKRLLKVKFCWWCINLTFGTINRVFLKLKNAKEHDPAAHEKTARTTPQPHLKYAKLFPDLIVRHGPFKGMRYPSLKSIKSEIYPKLLGTYEQEISEAIAYIVQQPYTAMVDIGCAEGYYAVGLGMRCKKANIYAFDTNEEALELCRSMARLNGVDIQTGSFCDQKTLLELNLGEKALIFSDCEGYEVDLFSSNIIKELRCHDFLIETHDFVKIEITQNILERFTETHDCEIFESIDDIIKAYNYDFPELEGFELKDRLQILSEKRPIIMRWILAKARQPLL